MVDLSSKQELELLREAAELHRDQQRHLDTRAIEISIQALTKIDSHERVCEQRWLAVHGTLVEVKKAVDGIWSRMWLVAASVISMLMTVIGYLIVRYGSV